MIELHSQIPNLPVFERHELASQMRRASKSIPSNIAEGWAKRTFQKEFKKHLGIALGSANEMEVHIEIARDLNYLPSKFCNNLLERYANLGGMISNLRKNWKTY